MLVQSPCTTVCRIDPKRGLCEGCLRTLGEIAEWPTAVEARRRAIIDDIARRR